jgi:hypothetical protein
MLILFHISVIYFPKTFALSKDRTNGRLPATETVTVHGYTAASKHVACQRKNSETVKLHDPARGDRPFLSRHSFGVTLEHSSGRATESVFLQRKVIQRRLMVGATLFPGILLQFTQALTYSYGETLSKTSTRHNKTNCPHQHVSGNV